MSAVPIRIQHILFMTRFLHNARREPTDKATKLYTQSNEVQINRLLFFNNRDFLSLQEFIKLVDNEIR